MGSVVLLVWHNSNHGGNVHVASPSTWISTGEHSSGTDHFIGLRRYGCQRCALWRLPRAVYADECRHGLSRQDVRRSLRRLRWGCQLRRLCRGRRMLRRQLLHADEREHGLSRQDVRRWSRRLRWDCQLRPLSVVMDPVNDRSSSMDLFPASGVSDSRPARPGETDR